MIRLGGHTIALSTNCSFECTMNTLDARTKDDVGAVEKPEYVTWNISCESLLGINEGTEQLTHSQLMRLFLAGTPVEVEVMLASGASGAVPPSDWSPGPSAMKGFTPYAGTALIKSLSLTGEASGNAKINIQLGGQGELREVEYPLTARVEGSTLVIDGPAEVERGELLVEGKVSVTDNTLNI